MSKAEKIREEIERLKAETFDNKELSLEEIIAVRNCYNNLLFFIDSLEQPIKRTPADIEAAMQEVEEKSKLFTEAHKDDVVSNDTIKVVSNDLEEAANSCSSCIYLEEVLSDDDKEVLKERLVNTFKAGAQWQKERDQSTIELAEDHAYLAGQGKIIEKACVWLNNFYSEDRHCYLIKEDIDNFKKAMEE